MVKTFVIQPSKAPEPLHGAPYSLAITVDNLVFVSGRIAMKPEETTLTGSSVSDQTEQIFAKRHAGVQPPARSTVHVAKLPAGALVEIDVIAHT